jgi:hypothetical protein
MTDTRLILSAAALRITSDELAALLRLQAEIKAGLIVHNPTEKKDCRAGINMNAILNEASCGTTGCIGGWMYHFIFEATGHTPATTAFRYVQEHHSKPLKALFFPFTDHNEKPVLDSYGDEIDFPYELIDTDTVLLAIENFLANGYPDYQGILASELEEV